MANLKLALRTLFKTPFVTAVAVLSLALGIGANAAIFSLFNQMLLRPLPVPRARALVNLAAPGPNAGSQSCNHGGRLREVFSYPMFRDLEKAQTVFTGIAAHRSFGANLVVQTADARTARAMFVSGSYFPVLELRPALGRLLAPVRRPDHRRAPGRRPRLQLLGDAARRRIPAVHRAADHRQRPAVHDRRRRAEGVRGDDARRAAEGLRADHHARRC